MSKLNNILSLTITLVFLTGCSVKNASNTGSSLSHSDQEIKESAPVKLKKITPQERIAINKQRNPNQKVYQAISEPLEVNRKIKEVYLLQLKAIELMIDNLEKVDSSSPK